MRKNVNAILAVIVLVCLIIPASGWSETDIPDTYAGKMLGKMVTAVNSGDENQWREFVLLFPKARDSVEVLERRLDFMKSVYSDLGGIIIDTILQSSEYAIGAGIIPMNPAAEDEYLRLMLNFDTAPPHEWRGVGLMPEDNPHERLPEIKSDKDLADFLSRYIDSLAAEDAFSGAVLVAKGDNIIFEKAVGDACKRYSVPNKIDTKFNLGSMNKMFTGTAIVQLAQQGKLKFEDPIIKYLPDYPNKEVAEKVTIHQLLTHTSGMGDFWEVLSGAKWWEIKTVSQLAAQTVDKPLLFEPGAQMSYSNAGVVVLGLIIEKLSGMDYYEYIRKNIYEPAGMINSDSYEMDEEIPNLAIGYTKQDYEGRKSDRWYNNLFMHFAKGSPAGGGYSTVEDMFRFGQALKNGKLVNAAYFDTLTTGKVDMGPDMKYAYLFGDRRIDGHRIIGHNGGAPGINATFDLYLDNDYTVVVLANYDVAALRMARLVRKLLIG